jgi:pimeloyl-ACP methyl ester carboxylesterase
MKKTLLLVFIHGFKGTDQTFHKFPQDLRALIAHTLPRLNVVSLVYPQYETKGDLKECVAKFKDWLQNKVIDLEVEARTPSPTVDPSVHVILCGHSMGGIVAAEALLSIAADAPVIPSSFPSSSNNTTNTTATSSNSTSSPPFNPSNLIFPHISALIAFDTPFLGLNPGIIAHNAEQKGTTVYDAYTTASSLFGWKNTPSTSGSSTPNPAVAASRGLPSSPSSSSDNPTPSPGWLKKYAMYSGAAAALAGVAGAATYYNWSHINDGLSWAGSHLQFVGCLARGAELQKRVEKVVRLGEERGVGFVNFYGALGEGAGGGKFYGGLVEGTENAPRTFCVVPRKESNFGRKKVAGKKRSREEVDDDRTVGEEMSQGSQVRDFVKDGRKSKGEWIKCVNPMAEDEVQCHTAMFEAVKNPDYFGGLVPRVRDWVVELVKEREGEWFPGGVEESEDGGGIGGVEMDFEEEDDRQDDPQGKETGGSDAEKAVDEVRSDHTMTGVERPGEYGAAHDESMAEGKDDIPAAKS